MFLTVNSRRNWVFSQSDQIKSSLVVCVLNETIFDQNSNHFCEYSLFIRIFVRTNMERYSNLVRSSFERIPKSSIQIFTLIMIIIMYVVRLMRRKSFKFSEWMARSSMSRFCSDESNWSSMCVTDLENTWADITVPNRNEYRILFREAFLFYFWFPSTHSHPSGPAGGRLKKSESLR